MIALDYALLGESYISEPLQQVFLCLKHILKADKLSKQFFRINKSMNLSYLHLRSLMSHDH